MRELLVHISPTKYVERLSHFPVGRAAEVQFSSASAEEQQSISRKQNYVSILSASADALLCPPQIKLPLSNSTLPASHEDGIKQEGTPITAAGDDVFSNWTRPPPKHLTLKLIERGGARDFPDKASVSSESNIPDAKLPRIATARMIKPVLSLESLRCLQRIKTASGREGFHIYDQRLQTFVSFEK